MSGVVILGKDSSNNALRAVELDTNGKVKCDVTLPTGSATDTLQTAGNSSLATIATNTTGLNGCVAGTELQVDIVANVLASGASTDTLQTAGNSSLSTIATNSAKGQANTASSLSVTLSSDHATLSVSAPALSVTTDTIMSAVSQATGGTASSSVIDMRTSKCVAIYGSNTDTSAEYRLMASSTSGGTYYEVNSVYITGDYATGDFGLFLDNVGASYLRLDYINTSGVTKTITAIAEIKK